MTHDELFISDILEGNPSAVARYLATESGLKTWSLKGKYSYGARLRTEVWEV